MKFVLIHSLGTNPALSQSIIPKRLSKPFQMMFPGLRSQ